MKLSDIILEIKRIGKEEKEFKVPVYVPGRGNQVLTFTKREIDFKFEDNTAPVGHSIEYYTTIKKKDGEKPAEKGWVSAKILPADPEEPKSGIRISYEVDGKTKKANVTDYNTLRDENKNTIQGIGPRPDSDSNVKRGARNYDFLSIDKEKTGSSSLLYYGLRYRQTLLNIKNKSEKDTKGIKKLDTLLKPFESKHPELFANVSKSNLSETNRRKLVENWMTSKKFQEIINSNPDYVVLPILTLVRTMKVKHKFDYSDLVFGTATPDDKKPDTFGKQRKLGDDGGTSSVDKNRELFLRVSDFNVSTDKINYKYGIYVWVIDGEARYVGLTTDTANRPGNYGTSSSWTSGFGATADRINAYITKRLDTIKTKQEAHDVVRVYTAAVEPTAEDKALFKDATTQSGKSFKTFDKYYQTSILTPVEGQVKGWTNNLTTGKVDLEKLDKIAQQRKSKDPKVNKGKGSYGRSGDVNVDPISKAMDPDTGEDLFEK